MVGKIGITEKPLRNADQGRDEGADNSLLPMLIGGLILIVVGAIIVMAFV